MVSHLLPVSVWSIVSWATILLPAELIPLPEEANRSRPKTISRWQGHVERNGDGDCVKACARLVVERMAPVGRLKNSQNTVSADMCIVDHRYI